jgi:hypothetical protein
MPKIFCDDYFTVVAETKEDAIRFFLNQELTDEDGLEDIREVNPDKKKMWFPVDELPEQYHDEQKYPRKNWCGQYVGVEITLTEAMKYRKPEPLPYIICASSDVV